MRAYPCDQNLTDFGDAGAYAGGDGGDYAGGYPDGGDGVDG